MTGFDEMPVGSRVGLLVLISLIAGGVFYFAYYHGKLQVNRELRSRIGEKNRENEQLRQFDRKLVEMNRTLTTEEMQLERMKKVVPEDKDADQLIRILHDTAATSGIEIRRYTAMPVASHEVYSEVPFQVDLDGSYFSVLSFFQRVAALERIVTIDNLQVSNTKYISPSKVKMMYTYAPGETVVASCTVTTFFSHPPMAVATALKGAPPSVAQVKPAMEPNKPRIIRPRVGPRGRRDPFVNPRHDVSYGRPGPDCSGGKRCLAIQALVLLGTVKDISGKLMAVVANTGDTRRTYTLRENDPVFNGHVEKITKDSVVFRQFVKDAVGRESGHEVVKKLGPAS